MPWHLGYVRVLAPNDVRRPLGPLLPANAGTRNRRREPAPILVAWNDLLRRAHTLVAALAIDLGDCARNRRLSAPNNALLGPIGERVAIGYISDAGDLLGVAASLAVRHRIHPVAIQAQIQREADQHIALKAAIFDLGKTLDHVIFAQQLASVVQVIHIAIAWNMRDDARARAAIVSVCARLWSNTIAAAALCPMLHARPIVAPVVFGGTN